MQGNNMIYCTELTCSHFHRMVHHCAWGAYSTSLPIRVIQIIGPTDQDDHILEDDANWWRWEWLSKQVVKKKSTEVNTLMCQYSVKWMDCMFYVLLHLITLYVKSWCTERAQYTHTHTSLICFKQVIPFILKRSSSDNFLLLVYFKKKIRGAR